MGKGTNPPARRTETSPQEANSKVKGNNTGIAGIREVIAAGAAAKHQRGKHRHCNCSTAQLPREGTRG